MLRVQENISGSKLALISKRTLQVALLSLVSMTVTAAEMESSYARGGQLYDKWFKVIKADKIKVANPAYPKDKKYYGKKGADWRCKECHGWDYKGVDGAYAKGKHHTGIKGVSGAAGKDTVTIIATLKNKTHGLSGKLKDKDFTDLANFISAGQEDFDKYINSKTKAVIGGNKAKGEVYFNTICAKCHGIEGDRPSDMGKSLGKQMGNPWEVMHKILNGNPDEKMPSLRALNRQIVVDIMAHIDTLPKKKLKKKKKKK